MLPIAKIATNGEFTNLPIRPRTHSLVIGPSGSGKSFIAQEIGRRLNLPVLLINVSSWVVLSAKNEPWTTSSICSWLDSIGNIGGILIFDELDKIHEGGEWMSYIRNELHDLLDGVIPHAARMPNQPTEDLWESTPNIESQRLTRTMLTSRLRNKVFVIACGAFQTAWTSISRKIGFEIENEYSERPSRLQILASINPEVRQRFRDNACWLEPMKLKDFQGLSTRIADELPSPAMRRSWHRLAKPAIERAVAGGLGMRIFEELMLSVLLDESTVSAPHIEDGKQPYI